MAVRSRRSSALMVREMPSITGFSKGFRQTAWRKAPTYWAMREGFRSAITFSITMGGWPASLMFPCMDRLWRPWPRVWASRVWATAVAASEAVATGWSMISKRKFRVRRPARFRPMRRGTMWASAPRIPATPELRSSRRAPMGATGRASLKDDS